MKKTERLAAVLAFCALALCGCSEKKAQDTQEAETEQEEVSQVVETIHYAKVGGTMIYSGWTLYLENDEGKMIASAETRAGDIVEVSCEGEDGANPVEKEAIRRLQSGKEETFTFAKVTFDGEDYWTRPIFVAKSCIPCVALNDGRLFSAPDMATMTKNAVKQSELLAMSTEDAENGFNRVFIYDGTPYGKEMYIQASSTSTDFDTIEWYATEKRIAELGDDLKPEVKAELEDILGYIGSLDLHTGGD